MNRIRYGLLKYVLTDNIGDEIQSIAAKRFLPSVDYYINRDNFNEFNSNDKIKMILNGWFTHSPENWPPKKSNIQPLIISFHITERCYEKFSGPSSIEFFKKHEPIGCRDYNTLNFLADRGVRSYFSGCLTLTLENKFTKRNDKVYLVDINESLKNIIPPHIKDKVVFLTHHYNPFIMKLKWKLSSVFSISSNNYKKRFKKAQEQLNMYASAKLVVTSKIHCALPCLALGTPVVFIYKNKNDSRYEGIIELLRNYSLYDVIEGKELIDWDNPQPNPVDIMPIRNKLIKTCEDFIKRSE